MTQLEWMRDFQEVLRSSFMDSFFMLWSFVDTLYFSIFLLTCIWYLWDQKVGVRFFYLLVISFTVNQALKYFFNHPRPCQIDPSLGMICLQEPSFPSGAAQTATLVAGIILLETKNILFRVCGLIFAFFLCVSRVYLGVHYPTDILGGIAVGGALLVLYAKGFPRFEKYWKILAFLFPLALLIVGLFLPIAFSKIFYFVCATLGCALGLLQKECARKKRQEIKFLPFLSVLAGLGFLFFLGYQVPRWAPFLGIVQGYWLSFLGERCASMLVFRR